MNPLRQHLIAVIKGGIAYDTFEGILAEFKPEDRGVIPKGAEHSAWQIVEHMRISLRDILDYSQNEGGTYRERNWPDDYWPSNELGDWEDTVQGFKADRGELERLALDPNRDLLKPFPWAPEHSLLREVLLACDHAAYHLGELVELKRWIDAP